MPHLSVAPPVDPPAALAIQMLALRSLHRDVAGKRLQERDIRVRVIRLLLRELDQVEELRGVVGASCAVQLRRRVERAAERLTLPSRGRHVGVCEMRV
jgi:hypothetical protein